MNRALNGQMCSLFVVSQGGQIVILQYGLRSKVHGYMVHGCSHKTINLVYTRV